MDINKLKLSRSKAKSICLAETWDPAQAPNLTDESLKKLREGLCNCLKPIFEDINNYTSKKDYTIDCLSGLAIKAFLEQEENDWFSLRLAANDDFWAFLSVEIIPDIVYNRYEKSIDHYCWNTHRNRIWLKAIWWYVFLSWQGDVERTKTVLLCPALNTDAIVALVERPGKGMRIDFCRTLMKFVAQISNEASEKFKKDHTIKHDDGKDKSTTIFRALMKANTALSAFIEPDLCKGGVDGYVEMLFKDFKLPTDSSLSVQEEVLDDCEDEKGFPEHQEKITKVSDSRGELTFVDEHVEDVSRFTDQRSIIIPNTITSIHDREFYGFSNLEQIVIPETVTSIGAEAFCNCIYLRSVTCRIQNLHNLNIASDAFENCDFKKCKLYVPTRLQGSYRNNHVFVQFDSVLPIPESVVMYSEDGKVLRKAQNIEGNFVVPETVEEIGCHAFDNCIGLTSISIPQSVKTINDCAFLDCCYLEDVILHDSLAEIGDKAFKNCSRLKNINLPNTLSRIGECAFEGCVELSSIQLPGGLKVLGEYAFDNCSALTSVGMPASIEFGSSVFGGCTSLKTFCISNENPNYIVEDGIIFSKDRKKLVAFPPYKDCTSYRVPDSVETIGNYAFYACRNIRSIEMPFSIKVIGNYAFSACSSIVSIHLSDSVKTIGNYAFYECTSLSEVWISKSVSRIFSNAFTACPQLRSVHCKRDVSMLKVNYAEDAFDFINARLYIPKGLISTFRKKRPFCNFRNIIEE